MRTLTLQKLTTIRGAATAVTSVTQSQSGWLDMGKAASCVVTIEVRQADTSNGAVFLNLETSATLDDSLFAPLIAPIPLTGAVGTVLTRLPTQPLARWVRWRLSTTATGGGTVLWGATFRVYVA